MEEPKARAVNSKPIPFMNSVPVIQSETVIQTINTNTYKVEAQLMIWTNLQYKQRRDLQWEETNTFWTPL